MYSRRRIGRRRKNQALTGIKFFNFKLDGFWLASLIFAKVNAITSFFQKIQNPIKFELLQFRLNLKPNYFIIG